MFTSEYVPHYFELLTTLLGELKDKEWCEEICEKVIEKVENDPKELEEFIFSKHDSLRHYTTFVTDTQKMYRNVIELLKAYFYLEIKV